MVWHEKSAVTGFSFFSCEILQHRGWVRIGTSLRTVFFFFFTRFQRTRWRRVENGLLLCWTTWSRPWQITGLDMRRLSSCQTLNPHLVSCFLYGGRRMMMARRRLRKFWRILFEVLWKASQLWDVIAFECWMPAYSGSTAMSSEIVSSKNSSRKNIDVFFCFSKLRLSLAFGTWTAPLIGD